MASSFVERVSAHTGVPTAFASDFGSSAPAAERKVRPTTRPGAPIAQQNRLLGSLAPQDLARWRPQLEVVRLTAGQLLVGSGAAPSHVHFPLDAVTSLVCLTEDGGATEVISIGNEGAVGLTLFLGGGGGGSGGTRQVIVQSSGLAYRLRMSAFRDGFERSATVRAVLLRYMESVLLQAAQMVVCNRRHTVEQQLCRWLLAAIDRRQGGAINELKLTQELIANALGVRRAGITEAATRLRRNGLLRCQRGRITVLDRPGLERRACECYAAMRRQMGDVPAAPAPRTPPPAAVDRHAATFEPPLAASFSV